MKTKRILFVMTTFLLISQLSTAQTSWDGTSTTSTASRQGKTGIGTNDPKAKLHILHYNQDPNGNALMLGPANASNLRFGYHQDYSWIQSHGNKPLILNLLPNFIGIGTANPDAPLSIQRRTGNVITTKDHLGITRFAIHSNHAVPFYHDLNATNYDLRLSSYVAGGSGGNISFWTGVGSPEERMRVEQDGKAIFLSNLAKTIINPNAQYGAPIMKMESQHPTGMVIKANLSERAPAVDAYLTLESSRDYRGRGIFLAHREAADTHAHRWFMGVPYKGGGFGIGSSNQPSVHDNNGAAYRNNMHLFISPVGNVGVGIQTPGKKLEVAGNLVSRHSIDAGGTAVALAAEANGLGSIWTNNAYDPANSGSGWKRTINMINGQVGIGALNIPAGYKLAVDGKVICEELKVQLSENWPDYVFADDYDLPTLKEVAASIEKQGHLPDMPSAAFIEAEGGIELGEMQRKMMEKIEELTLYILEQETRIKKLETQLQP